MKLFGTIEFDEDLVNKKYVDDAISKNAKTFVAVYEQTTYADVIAAIDANKVIMLDMPANHNLFNITHATYTNGGNAIMYAIFKMNNRATLITVTLTPTGNWTVAHTDLQEKLESGTSIKTINNESLLGSGNISIGSGGEAIGIIKPWIAAMNLDQAYETLQNYSLCVLETNQHLFPILRWHYTGGIQPKVTIWCSTNPGLGIVNIYTCTKGAGTGGADLWSDGDAFQSQEKLTSGTNIKTINYQSILGKGNLNIGGSGTVDTAMSDTSENSVQNKVIKSYVDNADTNLQSQLGTLTDLTTDNKDSLVNAINEVYEKSGEPFRVKQWGSNALNVEIPTCTEDISNTAIPKMVFSIDNVEGADYQIVGMLAYEVFDATSGGNRINCWPVCQFTGNGQKELSVRWMCGGTTRKTAKRINAWVLLKHR